MNVTIGCSISSTVVDFPRRIVNEAGVWLVLASSNGNPPENIKNSSAPFLIECRHSQRWMGRHFATGLEPAAAAAALQSPDGDARLCGTHAFTGLSGVLVHQIVREPFGWAQRNCLPEYEHIWRSQDHLQIVAINYSSTEISKVFKAEFG